MLSGCVCICAVHVGVGVDVHVTGSLLEVLQLFSFLLYCHFTGIVAGATAAIFERLLYHLFCFALKVIKQ